MVDKRTRYFCPMCDTSILSRTYEPSKCPFCKGKMEKVPEPKELIIEIEMKHLDRIANFYEFPVAVFFGNAKLFGTKTTLRESLQKDHEMIEKIREIINDE